MTTAAVVKERPILFSGPMVRALLGGTKTQTRRIVKPQPLRMRAPTAVGEWTSLADYSDDPATAFDHRHLECPYGRPGERLWVRETYGICPDYRENRYRADPWTDDESVDRWRPSIHMPRSACRIVLEITDLRSERLADITEADARAEGVTPDDSQGDDYFPGSEHQIAFARLWDEINGAGAWEANPWVWALTFRPVVLPTLT